MRPGFFFESDQLKNGTQRVDERQQDRATAYGIDCRLGHPLSEQPVDYKPEGRK